MLLHGLSDSPYSLRSMAGLLYEQGLSVLTMRLPGHGTAPSGLLRSDHLDWMAAVRLGMRHLAGERDEGQPLFIIGYSTGAALALEYATARLLGEDLPPAHGLILLSPAIGVSPLVAFAVWQSRLAALPGLHTLAWTEILPEYDPYKYKLVHRQRWRPGLSPHSARCEAAGCVGIPRCRSLKLSKLPI